MIKLLHLVLLLFCCSGLIHPAQAAPDKRAIPTFIDENRRNHDIIMNSAKYDPKAKVYFIYHTSTSRTEKGFEENTRFLIPAYKKIHHRGAELIICIRYTDEDAEDYKKYKKYDYLTDIPQECRSFALKCPIVNSFNNKVRSALFKADKHGRGNYVSYPSLRAVDADGIPVAFFYPDNDSIAIYDCETRQRRVLVQSGFPTDEWPAHAILASFQDLVNKASQKEAPAEAAESQGTADEEAERPKKKKRKSTPARKNRWKKLDI